MRYDIGISMRKYRPQRTLAEFLKENDVPCTSCGYNLRGCTSTTCPECGFKLRYESLKQFIAQHASFQRVETTEYRMYRSVSRFVILVLAIDSLLFLLATRYANLPLRLLITLLGLMLATGMWHLRSKLYRSPHGANYLTDPRAERNRDRFGALCLIAVIPLTALLLALLSFVR